MKRYTIHTISREIEDRFFMEGFKKMNSNSGLGIDGAYHKRGFQITKFGWIDTFLMCHFAGNKTNINDIKSISNNMFKSALNNKMWIPRSLGNGVILYSIFIMKNPSSEIKQFFESYNPWHYAAFEFLVLIDIGSNEVFFFQGTPAWGIVYYHGIRKMVRKMFSLHGMHIG